MSDVHAKAQLAQRLPLLLMAMHALLLGWSATRHSPVPDEIGHLVAGISHWERGRFDLYRVNPPLTRLVATLPAMCSDYDIDYTHDDPRPELRAEFDVGRDFVRDNGAHTVRLVQWGRLACIPLSLVGAWSCYYWAKDLYGRLSGLCALTLWCFSPNVLAHAALMTPDIAGGRIWHSGRLHVLALVDEPVATSRSDRRSCTRTGPGKQNNVHRSAVAAPTVVALLPNEIREERPPSSAEPSAIDGTRRVGVVRTELSLRIRGHV